MNKDINFIHIDIMDEQADLILRALELYAYNLEYMVGERDEADILKLTALSSIYEKINLSYNSAKNRPNEIYNIPTLKKQIFKDYKKGA